MRSRYQKIILEIMGGPDILDRSLFGNLSVELGSLGSHLGKLEIRLDIPRESLGNLTASWRNWD